MRPRQTFLIAACFTLALTAAASAPAGEIREKCSEPIQACLDQMARHVATAGWLGIDYDDDPTTAAPTVTAVVAGGPAATAGFARGDVLVAFDGIAITAENGEKLRAARQKMPPGTKVTYTVKRGGKDLDLAVTLGEMPREVRERFVGQHMLNHATVATAAK